MTTALAAVSTPEALARAFLDTVEPEIDEALPHILSYSFETQRDFDQAGEVLVLLGQRLKEVEAERKAQTGPAYQEWQNQLNRYRPYVKKLEQAIMVLKRGGEAFLERERKKAEEALAAAAASGSAEAIAAVEVPTVPKGLSARGNVTYEVVDEKLVPDEFWMLNHSAIDRAVREGREIPGIKRVTKTELRRTGRA